MDVYAWLALALMAAGVLGTFVPMLPGMWLVFASILGYGIFDGWVSYPIWYAVIVGAIAIGSTFLDYVGVSIGAGMFGTSKSQSTGANVGYFVGGFVNKRYGSRVGSVVGSVGSEYKEHGSFKAAVRACAGSLVGSAVVSFIQFVVALILFVITFVLMLGAY